MPGDTVNMEKKRLRLWAAEIAGAMPENEIKAAGAAITDRVLSSPPYRQAAAIFIYVSMPREPDTRALIEHAWRTGKAVYVPKCRGQGRMDAAQVFDWNDFAPGAYGIPEPKNAPADRPLSPIDLAIVPCVCASPDGRRLGHGAGYYDRFLQARSMPCMCLCFHVLLRTDIPVGPLDRTMDAVITERAFFQNKAFFSGQKSPQGL